MLKYGIVFTAALIFGIVFTFLLARYSLKHKILKIESIPSVGGLGIGMAFIFSLGLGIYVFNLATAKMLAIAGAGLLMLALGVIDDLKELSVAQKFFVQSCCAVLLIISGVRTEIMYFGFWPNAVITFFWILGITNAFNLLDIMDGLAAGVSLIISSAFLWIGLFNADLQVQVLSLILCALSAGFLIFNMPPAKVYLGNSGSHFLGLLIASLALITHYASSSNVFALFSPIMIVGLPVMDTILLIIFRMIKNKPPFNKSRDHLALKIGALGFSPVKTILIMYLLGAIFASCGIILTRVNNIFGAVITTSIFLLSIGIFFRLVKIETNG
ncbi:MAG: MraY family glycosyltransferase [Candidatus Omnitrophica bacterium]|jgi:UDP-GlcNAc:undecaprenyl-phosphate GlcNAc-1-phosphate transferase|nr:MraY family glycosyltransferase [Candidatus Omnitrophota bacterium]MDD5660764.1 MraY family glycosyltransferase [Candidatus Omnitrophota bacterium]